MTNPVRLCKDCRHFQIDGRLCIRPIPKIGEDFVYGLTTERRNGAAQQEREAGGCGRGARYFEGKAACGPGE